MTLLIGGIQKYGTNERIYNRNRVTDVENILMGCQRNTSGGIWSTDTFYKA